jgi:tRNA-intron endonuclease
MRSMKILRVKDVGGLYAVEDEASRLLLSDKRFINPDEIDPIELAYLIYMGDFKVYINGRPASIMDVLRSGDLEKFMVYLDLRNRGLYVKPVRDGKVDMLVWDKKKNALSSNPQYVVKILDEGRGIRTTELLELTDYAERNGMKLVLALLSSEGTLTYYRAFTIEPSQRDAEWLRVRGGGESKGP